MRERPSSPLRIVTLALGLAAVGCGAQPSASDAGHKDGGGDGGASDGGLDAGTDAGSDGGCTLGTIQSCHTCGDVCPGPQNAGTTVACVAGSACSIFCRGEFYDIDGEVSTGCEAEDLPIQDTATVAVPIALPAYAAGTGSTPCDGTINPCTAAAQVYGDARIHDTAPQYRAIGREDWFKVTASGAGAPVGAPVVKACLGISNFPADDQFSLCISEDGSETVSNCTNVTGGGASGCVRPAANVDVGVFYVRVQKTAGAVTANKYALYLEH